MKKSRAGILGLECVGLQKLAAFDVMAALGCPMKINVGTVIGHAVGGIAPAPRAQDEVAIVPIAVEKGIECGVDTRFFVLGRNARQCGELLFNQFWQIAITKFVATPASETMMSPRL